jgi:hypothetical protein
MIKVVFDQALLRFHQKFFADTNIPVDDQEVFLKIIEELSTLKRNKNKKKG